MHLDLDILTKKQNKQKQKQQTKQTKSKIICLILLPGNTARQGCEVGNIILVYARWLILWYFCFSADMGGTMGLFLGCSLLTLFEFLDLLIMASFRFYAVNKAASKKVNHKSEAYDDSVWWKITYARLRTRKLQKLRATRLVSPQLWYTRKHTG